ncbi:MAG: hypothetical protein IJ418_10735 [Clostridia bacterium]|nr:hypothetical protein [Clostridia bacterium]
MRSNKKSATRFLLSRNLFIGVIVFLAAFYMMPFWGLSHIPSEKETLAAMDLAAPEVITERFTQAVSVEVMTMPLNLELMVILYGGLGFLTAMMLMRHQFSRRQSMLHAALPDKRERDFLRRCIGYVALCLVPICINFMLYLLVVALNGLIGYVEWNVLLPKFGMLLIINFYGFVMGVLASVLTGTYWAALLAGGVLIVGVEALAALWYWLGGRYLHTLVKDSFTDALLRFSPAYSLYKTFYKPTEFACWPGVAAIALALVLGFVLYRIRKAERAEHTLAFAPLHDMMGFALPLLGGTFLGIVVKLSFVSEISLIVGMILGAFLTFWVCAMVFNQRFCGILKQWYLPAASAAVLVLGVVVLHHDLLGYDRFLPDREKLTAITYQPRSYDTSEIITLTSDEALDAAYAWCELMHGEVNSYENGPIEGSSAFSGSDVVITYQMGDRKVHRHYPNRKMRSEAQDSLRRIIESDDYRQSIISGYHLDTGYVTRVHINTQSPMLEDEALFVRFGHVDRSYDREKDDDAMNTLLSALKWDILNRTLEERQQDALLSISLNIGIPGSNETLYKQLDIYPGDMNVLKVLFGSDAQEMVQYMAGGYADSEDIAVLKVDYAYTRKEMSEKSVSPREAIQSVTLAASAEQAKEWIAHSQNTAAKNYYYEPYIEEDPYGRLYVYRMSTVEKYSGSYGYEVPEDKTKLYEESMIPNENVLDYIGAN